MTWYGDECHAGDGCSHHTKGYHIPGRTTVGTIEGVVICLPACEAADGEKNGEIGQDSDEYCHNRVQS